MSSRRAVLSEAIEFSEKLLHQWREIASRWEDMTDDTEEELSDLPDLGATMVKDLNGLAALLKRAYEQPEGEDVPGKQFDLDAIVEAHGPALGRALRRRELRQKGQGMCMRCELLPAMGHVEQPRLCDPCFGEVIDLQEAAYAMGRRAFCVGKTELDNPFLEDEKSTEDDKIRNAHWRSGYHDARHDGGVP